MKRFLSSLWFLSILFIFISCEIGLGASVDTEAPQLEIQNPSPDAIIRGAFKIGGIWSDDGTIETVTVKLSRTDGKGSEIEYQANFAESNDDSPNTWNCIINPQDSANTVLDGNYIAQVDITDGGKHTTTKTVQFAIDNTAPVIVLQRPSTKDDAQQLDSYGQKFTLEGQAADDNNVSLIEVQIFADKECTTLLHTVPLSNVPNSINLDVAEFKENIETDYSKIYGSTQKMGQKNFYCKVVAYDGAVYYPYDRTQTPEDLKGNKTNIYYLYEDIATAVLGEVKITDVYHILSGVYGLEKNSTRSAETNSLITKVKSTLEKNVVKTGSFSLNPANNPTFSVSGKDGLEKDENGKIDLSNGKYDILNKSQVVIEVSPGLDNIPLDSESLKVYFLECDVNGNAISTTKIYPTTVNSKSGSTYKFITPIGKSAGLSIGKYYLFGVDGTDQKNNSVVANSSLGYGFCCSSSGEAPTLTISQPVETSINLLKDGKIKIAGTTSVEFNAPVITIKEGSTVLQTITLKESEGKEDPETKKIFYNFETEIGITGESANTSGYHEIDIISSCAGVNSSPRTKTINYDCDNPVIVLSTVSPVVERNEKKNLNAKTTFTFQLSDAFSFIETESEEKRPVYEFTAGDKTEKIISERKDSNITESLTIDTTKFPDNTPLKIKVTVYDRAGNKSVKEFNDYFIDQSTDIPTVENSKIDFSLKEINSINNNEDTTLNRISAGGTVTFTVKEDDGVDHISLYKFNDEDKAVEDINFRYPKEGSTNEILLSYQFTLPETAGYYKYKLEVYDINNGTPFSEEFMLKAMNPAPKITVESTEITDDNDTENDGWIHAGGSYANKISIESTEFPITVYRKQKSSQETIEPVQLGKVPENSNNNVYTDTFQPTETASYVYYVIDCNGQKSNEVTFEAKVDKDAPEIDKDKFNLPGKEATKLGSATITGKVTDNKGSGIKSIELTFSREGKSATISPDVADSWFQDISFKTEDENNVLKELFKEEGEIFVTLKVTDYVGNSSESHKSFVYDKENPVITINDKSKIPAFINVEGTEAKVTIKDSYKLGSLKVTQTYTSTEGENKKVECTKEFSDGKESTETIPLPLSSINDGNWIKGTPQEGTYSYTFEVTDSVGNTASEEINKIIYDNTAPTVEITNPVGRTGKDSINSESYRFEGTFDEKNLLYVYYKIGARDFECGERPDISKDNGWEKAVISGTKWSFDKELVSGVTQQDNKLCEGSYDLYVCAIDQADNVGELKKQSFDVDFNYPAVTFDWESASDKNTAHQESSTIYFNGDFTFTVDFKDSYGLAETKVLLGDEELTGSNISGDGVHNITKSYTIEKSKLGEGNSKLLTITAKDKFDKETPLKYTLCYDSVGPVIEIDSPGAGTSVGKNTISLKASVRDETSKVDTKKVTYSISRTYNNHPESETNISETHIKDKSLTVTGEIIKVENFELCSDDKEGTYTITISAEDILGNQKSNTSTFYYDKSAPKLELNELSKTTTNKDIPVSGKVWDTNEIVSVEVFVDNEEQSRYEKVFESERPKDAPLSENFDVTFFVGAGNNNNSKLNLADGKHTIKVVAKDIAGKTTEETLSVLVDTKSPTIDTIKITNTPINDWYNKETLSFEGTMGDDGSGIEKIEYSLDNNFEDGHAHNLMISSKTAWRGNVENLKTQGLNTIYFRATDYAGNISESKSYNVYIDSKAPNELKLVSVDEDNQTWSSSTEKLTNGSNDIKLVLTASDYKTASDYNDKGLDTSSGLGNNAIEIVKIGSKSCGVKSQKEEGQEQFTITIPKEKIAGGTVKASVTDKAGNKSEEFELFTIKYDYLYPTVKINKPSDASAKKTGTQVNKTITLSGTATDNNELDPISVKLEYSEDGGSTWKDLTEVDQNAKVTVTNSEWTAKFDTTKFSNTTETKKIKLRGVATDKAGNVGNSGGNNENATNAYSDGNAIEIEIDQDTDRPVISFNNVTLGNAMSSSSVSNYIWLKNTTKLYGTVEDDDGITSMKISNNGTNWHDVTLNTAKTSWSFDVKTFFGDETADKEAAANGAHKIYFKVTDALGKEFTSATSSTLDSVYLVDGKIEYGTIGVGSAKPDSVLYVKVDTLPPEVILIGARIGTTGDFSNAYSNMTLGGAQRTMEFKLTAKDSNGIKSVSGTAEFEFDGASVTLSSPEDKTGESGDEETTVGETDAEYYIVSFTVDLKNENAQKGLDGKDGRISLKFTAKDKAGNSSAQTATINYDYKKPEVTITSPKDSNWVSGIVTAYGTIDSAATMYYALSPSDTKNPAEPDAVSAGGNITGQSTESETDDPHEVTTWSGINPDGLVEVTGSGITVTPKYSQIKGNGVQWFVYFDNQPSTELATHDVEFKKYLINSGITTDEAIGNKSFKTIVRLYLWVKSIDLAGNVTEEKFPILIDPQGDAPQVTISYPAKDGETLGGAVTLLGTASDTIGKNIGINNVWVQIMSVEKDSAATPTITKDDVDLWINNGYTVFTNIKNSTPTQVTSDNASSVIPADCYIKANVSGSSWSLKINGNDEFSPKEEGTTNTIVYRVYAQDRDNNFSKYQTQYSIFDADNPVLSDLYLRQYDGETITASRPYEDDMWIKGDWWLCGTVKDTQGIASLKVDEETITVSGELDKKEEFKYKISTTGSDAGNKTISIVAEDKASPSHTTKKTCSINFDNKDPDSFEPVIANNIIQNRNGFFTFSAEVKEDAVSGAAQSGFKYLAFYFTRRIKVNDNVYYDIVYDIMRSKTDEKNSAINTSGLTKGDDGLIWKKLTVTRDPDNLAIITLSAADANIHTGGLCKIGGSIYMIKNANGTTIELDGSPEMPASGTSQEALFAIANVVNNNIESGNGTKSTSADSYGYFTSISNDDGDHMVESVLKTGTTWKWEANINSRNIPDGEVTLHYVAFDAAGNYSAKEISGLQIANNAPRLASVKVWTDYNGNGIEDDNEHKTKYYSKKTVVIGGMSQTKSQDLTSDLLLSGNDKDEANDGSAFMTIKAETKLIPELVGGNGNLYYTYRTKPNKATDWSGYKPSNGSFATGNDNDIDDEADKNGYYVVDDENTAYISGTIYDGKTTGKNPIEITTAILGGLNNNENNSDPTWFEYVIYDSTEGCTEWSKDEYTKGRLSAKFKVALNVQYNDTVKPQVAVRPFYWNSKTDNSVCWDSTTGSALGHIELEGDLTPTITADLGNDPKVSGKIKIEGYAFDNIKLKELYVQFDGHKDISSEKKLAATYTTSTSENTTSWVKSSTAAGIGNTWDFEATDVFNNSEGHLVYWTLTVDTQEVDTQEVDTQAVDTAQVQVARLDQKVTVIAKDERGKKGTITGGLESASSEEETPGNQKMIWKDVKTSAGAATVFYTDKDCETPVNAYTSDNTTVYLKEKWDYQMDIVPYITGVKTSLSDLDANNPSVYNRTALGHYAVNSTETVDIYGFNLAGGTLSDSASTSTSVSLGTAKTNTSENAYGLPGAQYFSVSASTLKSGKIQIKVNNIPTLNNINKSDAKGDYSNTDAKYENHYNRTPNGLNNNLLEDDVIFDVWEFDSDAAVPRSGQVRQPIMKISPATGMIQFAFANGPLYFSMGGGNYLQDTTSHDFWSQSYDFFTSIGYTVDDLGYTYGVCAGGDINDHSADVFVLHSSRFGDPKDNRKKHGNIANESGLGLEQIAQNNGTSQKTNYVFLKERIMSPSLGSTVSGTSTSNASTNLYLAYIDNINGEIRFKSGTTSASNSTEEFGLFKDKYHTNSTNGITPGVYNINDVDVVANSNSAEYLSLGVVPSTVTKTKDVVVLVWNEGTTLKYAYNESPLQSGTVGENNVTKANFTWTIESLKLGSRVGKYCKVAVDKKGGIHVAAYDQMKGDLKYAYRSGYKSGTWQTCTVDSYGIIGSEISLDVAMSVSGVDAKPIPYISYYADSAVKPKIAYLNDVSSISDGATRDYFTQKWEVSYLPTSSIVPKDHINVGLWKNGSTGEIVNSMIAGSSDNNSFTNWQNNYGTYPSHRLVTKGTFDVNNTGNNASWGYKFANGTKNPMVAYQVGSGVSSTIETAQMK